MPRNHPERTDHKRLSRPDKQYTLHQDGLPLRMSDGTRLAADLYLPTGSGPWPVLLERTPYNKEASVEVSQVGAPAYFASRGYAVVIQDTRGRFKSEGEFYPFRDDGWGDNRDGYDTVEAIARQKWCNGRVGTLGGSYAGHTQYAMAPTAPPHLAGQFVRHSIDDFHDGWIFRGGAFELKFNLDWALVQSVNLVERDTADPTERDRRKKEIENALALRSAWYERLPLRDIPVLQETTPWYFDWLDHPAQGEYWQRWNLATGYEQVDAPICHFGSWFDTFLKGTVNNFNGISSQARSARARNSQRMILGPWFHGPTTAQRTKFGDFEFGPDAGVDFNSLRLPWFDHWLKGMDTISDWPAVQYFTMGLNEWQTADAWPPGDCETLDLYLASGPSDTSASLNDGRLTEAPHSAGGADSYVYDPADPVETLGGTMIGYPWFGPEYEAFSGPFDQRPVEPRCLTYTGPPLERDVEATGPVKATLFVSSSAPDTDWIVRLSDVSPDGQARPVAEGILRARYRESSAVERLAEPSEIYEVQVDLWSTSNLFRKGHRVRVLVTSSWFPRWDRNLNTGGPFGRESVGVPAENKVHFGSRWPSHITLTARTR